MTDGHVGAERRAQSRATPEAPFTMNAVPVDQRPHWGRRRGSTVARWRAA